MPSRMSLNVYLDRAQEGAAVRRREFGGCLENGVAHMDGVQGWARGSLNSPKVVSNCVFCLYDLCLFQHVI